MTGTSTVLEVNHNQTNPNGFTVGGVAEFQIADPVVALQGSSTADAPYLQVNLDTSDRTNVNVAYVLRDIDGSADNAVQPVALQYRVGETGPWTDLPAAYVADATTGPGLATQRTPVSLTLPVAAEERPQLQLRWITSDAPGSDEWVGIDDVRIGSTPNATGCTITGTPASETLTGTSGNDVICGRGGNDFILAGGGDDVLYGEFGNDTLLDETGDDSSVGGPGYDVLGAGTGADSYSGRDGDDRVTYATRTASLYLEPDYQEDFCGGDPDCEPPRCRSGEPGEEDCIDIDVEEIRGGQAADVITARSAGLVIPAASRLVGLGGDDTLDATDTFGVQVLRGGDDELVLSNRPSGVLALGGDGNDLLDFTTGFSENYGNCGPGLDGYRVGPSARFNRNCEVPVS